MDPFLVFIWPLGLEAQFQHPIGFLEHADRNFFQLAGLRVDHFLEGVLALVNVRFECANQCSMRRLFLEDVFVILFGFSDGLVKPRQSFSCVIDSGSPDAGVKTSVIDSASNSKSLEKSEIPLTLSHAYAFKLNGIFCPVLFGLAPARALSSRGQTFPPRLKALVASLA